MTRYHLTARDKHKLYQQERYVDSFLMAQTPGTKRLPRSNVWTRIVKTPTNGIHAYGGGTPGSGDCKLAKINTEGDIAIINTADEIEVWNLGPYVPGNEYVVVVKDPWSRWLIAHSDGVTLSAWFKTSASGVPAAVAPDSPSYAQAERLRFDGLSIVSAEDPPLFETIWNGAPAAVRENDFVQCCRIDGHWFVNVEYCRD